MNKIKAIFTLGVWAAILPYMGFPHFLKNLLLSVTGLGITYLSYLLYQNLKTSGQIKETFDNFSENGEFIGKPPAITREQSDDSIQN